MDSENPHILLDNIESIQDIMISVATGGKPIQTVEQEYKSLYREIALDIEALQRQGILESNPNQFKSLWDWYGYWSKNLSSYQSRREFVRRIYDDTIDILTQTLAEPRNTDKQQIVTYPYIPSEIQNSLTSFKADHPDASKMAFIMMKFSRTKSHNDIANSIKNTLSNFDLTAVRADDKQYHDDLFPNILTYIYGCSFGVAVFERIEADEFNPNVSLELGYMIALGKPVCLLKDKTLKTLHADLMGKLYRVFDPQDISNTITHELGKWLLDKKIANPHQEIIDNIISILLSNNGSRATASIGEVSAQMKNSQLKAFVKMPKSLPGWVLDKDGIHFQKTWQIRTTEDLKNIAEELITLNQICFNTAPNQLLIIPF